MHGLSLCCLLLGYDLTCVKFDEHRAVGLDFLHWYGQSEVVQKEKLEFEVVEFWKWQAANLRNVSDRLRSVSA